MHSLQQVTTVYSQFNMVFKCPTVETWSYKTMRFHLYSLTTAFSNRCVFGENGFLLFMDSYLCSLELTAK